MALQKHVPTGGAPSQNMKALSLSMKGSEKAELMNPGSSSTKPGSSTAKNDFDVDLSEVYFLIMHFLSAGPCHRTYGQFWNELLEHQLLPRRYHAWYSRSGERSGDENDDGSSLPLSYNKLVERYPHAEKDHLVKLLKQLMLNVNASSEGVGDGERYTAASVPTLLGTGSFSLLQCDQNKENNSTKRPPAYLRWPHRRADQMRGLGLREIGGGFTRHHRAPSVRAACYAIASPSAMVNKMQNIKKLRGHLNAVYCAIFDRSGRYVITGSDDRLVKIWSMETAYCLASCRGHEGDITDLAVSSNNALVASASNDCVIRVWRLADGLPISILRGHTKAVTAIAFSPRPGAAYHLLSSSDDGTCRIWDARHSHISPRIYVAAPPESTPGTVRNNGPLSSASQETLQIFCCAFNANGTVFVTGSSDTRARVWNACKSNTDESAPNHEIDCLSGHENDVNYVQFSGCSVSSRFAMGETPKEENVLKSKNSWLNHDNIVTCSRDGSAIIWVPRSRKSHGKVGKWVRSYHLKVPPPPMPPQAPRGGPRQRILPTPRGVNMIVWSLDNRFVLAAIMDCRICVWNAVDGDLVHSLTGHTESTYVLDVHPFDPRVAMSAGYDGKIIVWDIWEGKPIRTYQIGQFKLVDGKFSPDGTSIILSDDVGQLYVLSTGQGESQNDAKYDQFFLGDYRPLTQDTHGNVLDQETQLAPHRRNMQDLLCDASMIPYPEPYQSTYQQRRLGALGREWRPSAIRFAAGPDISLDQTYQMLPVVDLDLLIEPLPQFLDAMDWEPEIEVRSDDTDSEYNVTDEGSSGGEKGGLGSNSSDIAEYSGDDSGADGDQIDGLRRSRRKKHKADVTTMTSSGRRIKRRNVDESSDHSRRDNRSRKSRKGKQTGRRKKSSSSKSSRPQRVAATKALSLFSKISGTGADRENEDGSEEDDLSESASTQQDSNVSSEESDDTLQNKQHERSKGKEVLLDNYEDVDVPHECSETNAANTGNRMRLVLKFPIRDSRKPESSEYIKIKYDKKSDLVGTSHKSIEEIDEANENHLQDPDTSADLNCRRIGKSKRMEFDKVESNLNLLEGYDQSIKWGGSKARSSKRLKTGEVDPLLVTAFAESGSLVQGSSESHKDVNHLGLEKECKGTETSSAHWEVAGHSEELATLPKQLDHNELPVQNHNVATNHSSSSTPFISGLENHHPELKEAFVPVSTKLKIRTRRLPRDDDDCSKALTISSSEGGRNGACSELFESPDTKEILTSRLPGDSGNSGYSSDHQPHNSLVESECHLDGTSRNFLPDSHKSSLRDKMCTVVYRRSKSSKSRSNPKDDTDSAGPSTSTATNHNTVAGVDQPEAVTNGARRTRSMSSTVNAPNGVDTQNAINMREEHSGPIAAPVGIRSSTFNTYTELPSEERRSGSRVSVGLRSSRNRRSSYHTRDSSPPPNRRNSHQPARTSWLMLSAHEEGSRYIPQLGDEVVYMRQGHQECIGSMKGKGPWETMKGNIRAVEYCSVISLEYATHQGSGDSCSKITLRFEDASSSVFGESFRLTLLEMNDIPDFLVERSRFDAAMARKWAFRDKCQVWWKNPDGSGSWWDGRITSVKAKSPDFPDSPWERYVVQYKGSPPEVFSHSPWELHDVESQWEPPCIDDELQEKLLSDFEELENSGSDSQDYFGIQKLKQVSQKSEFVNRFPVPLTFEVIQSRLENNYYRGLEAVKHDVSVVLENAETFFAKNRAVLGKLTKLSNWFTKKFSSL